MRGRSDLPTVIDGRGARPTLLDRTLRNLRTAWRDIAAAARGAVGAPPRPSLPREDAERLKQQMKACLEARGGEVSARARAAGLGRTYLSLDATGRRNFLRILALDFASDPVAIDAAIDQVTQAATTEARHAAERTLRRVLEPGRLHLLTQFNGLPEGVKFLVDLRAEMLALRGDEPAIAELESDLKGLLRSWFDVGFLELRRITWDSPASLLERLISYEAVHAIRSWHDLKNRLDSDRRCFAFFHPSMPDEPLIFVEVALVDSMSDRIEPLLDEQAPLLDPRAADTAIFYSISNAQQGLAGISLGNFLIKRVVDLLTADLPNLKTFATLSPIPGFRHWLAEELAARGDEVLLDAERERLLPFAAEFGNAAGDGAGEKTGEGGRPLLAVLLDRPDWPARDDLVQALREPLLRLGAHYLLSERQKSGSRTAPRALDPVAHFHLSNGARMERLNFLGDTSPNGLRQSAGLMINYLYRLSHIEANHEAYRGEGKITSSTSLRGLLKNAG
ncbi:MAG TPA: malonyl-CoA decarboxylase [Arenibaculum sp.]|nr:malonyl-CoA decarboxylase [Arenibaculum sp.]